MSRTVYVNGAYLSEEQGTVSIFDRGFLFADGVYEVVGVRDGRLIDEGPHLDRLDRSLKELRIGWPVARSTISFVIRELMRRNRLRDEQELQALVNANEALFAAMPDPMILIDAARVVIRANAAARTKQGYFAPTGR